MVKTLILIRHSKAETRDTSISDFERPLSSDGKADTKKMADFLLTSGKKPDVIVTSSAARASETSMIFADIFKIPGKMLISSRKLYYCSAKTILDQIYSISDSLDCILVVAHNPGISDLTRGLSSGRTFLMDNTQTTILQYEIDHWYQLGEIKPVKVESFTLKDI
jgi:phosphohistidine phosphatase